jgi:hypothetical protein
MLNHVRVINVSQADRAELERRARAKSMPARDVQRARIVLCQLRATREPRSPDGSGCSEPTVICWRDRYSQCGLAGLDDRPREGRPPSLTFAQLWEILWQTVNPPPPEEGITPGRGGCWPARSECITSTIARVWARYKLEAVPAGHLQVLD